MNHRGFSHVGLRRLIWKFYEDVLGFKPVVADTIKIEEGGRIRHIFFDVGRDQLIAFIEADGVRDVPAEYDTGINHGLGVPASFYHFAFEAGSEAALADKREELRGKGVKVTDIIDHGWAKSIYFKDRLGAALDEGRPEMVFERAHLTRNRGLRHTALRRHGRERAGLGDSEKGPECGNQVHGSYHRYQAS